MACTGSASTCAGSEGGSAPAWPLCCLKTQPDSDACQPASPTRAAALPTHTPAPRCPRAERSRGSTGIARASALAAGGAGVLRGRDQSATRAATPDLAPASVRDTQGAGSRWFRPGEVTAPGRADPQLHLGGPFARGEQEGVNHEPPTLTSQPLVPGEGLRFPPEVSLG
ncbi:hypothetical protein H8959_009409 [Pygathrix nigripes]